MILDQRSERARACDLLARRIVIYCAYSSADFDSWLLDRLAVKPGDDVR